MRLLHEIAILQTVKSKVIISLFETVRLSVSISLRNLYNSLNSIKEKTINTQGLTNQKNFHLPTGQVKKKITCPVEELACPDFFSKIKNTLLYTLHSLKFGLRV